MRAAGRAGSSSEELNGGKGRRRNQAAQRNSWKGINGAGSITMQPGDKFIIDTLQCTGAWNGIAGGSGGILTILES